MRKMITDPGALNSSPFVIEADELTHVVIFEADGRTHRMPPDVARKIGRAMILAATVAEPLGPPGGIDDLGVDLAG